MILSQQKKLYEILKSMNPKEIEKLLIGYLTADKFELTLDDDMSILYLAFNGWLNNSSSDDIETIISSFIQYNLYKGAKSFDKKGKHNKGITQEFKDEWKRRFGTEVKE